MELRGSESDLRRQSVTEPEPMSSPINDPAYFKLSNSYLNIFHGFFNTLEAPGIGTRQQRV